MPITREDYDRVLARLDAAGVLSWEEAHILDLCRPHEKSTPPASGACSNEPRHHP